MAAGQAAPAADIGGVPVTWRALADLALATVFAPPCAACGQPLAHPLESAVCAACWDAIAPFNGPLCTWCGDLLPAWRTANLSSGRCPRCRRRPRTVSRQAAIGPYEGALRDILHALKYDRRRSVVAGLSGRMRSAGQAVLDGADLCVPVPLHWRRQWTRGFNQAASLASGLGVPVASLLSRARHTAPQAALPAAARHDNVRHAFRWCGRRARSWCAADGRLAPGLVLVLVDDVATTGSTLEACARVLREHGASEVRALTAARAVRGRHA